MAGDRHSSSALFLLTIAFYSPARLSTAPANELSYMKDRKKEQNERMDWRKRKRKGNLGHPAVGFAYGGVERVPFFQSRD